MKSLFTVKEGKIISATEEHANICVYVTPDADEKAEIIEQFGIDNNDLDSAKDPDEISRVEFLHKCTSIIWKNPTSPDVESATHFEVSTVGFFINNDALTIILSEETSILSEKIFEKVNSINDVLLRFFLYTIRQYLSNLKKIKQITSKIEGNLITSAENKYFLQMFDISERLVYYTNAIEGNSAALAKLRSNTDKLNLSQHQIYYLDDINQENTQIGRQANIYSSVLSGLMDARGNVINNNMNVLLRSLTMITVVFMPLNLLASMGGMSEFTMMLNEYNLPWQIGYLCFAAAMFIIGWLMWIFLKKYIGAPPQSS